MNNQTKPQVTLEYRGRATSEQKLHRRALVCDILCILISATLLSLIYLLVYWLEWYTSNFEFSGVGMMKFLAPWVIPLIIVPTAVCEHYIKRVKATDSRISQRGFLGKGYRKPSL